jgi:hypothetical protein
VLLTSHQQPGRKDQNNRERELGDNQGAAQPRTAMPLDVVLPLWAERLNLPRKTPAAGASPTSIPARSETPCNTSVLAVCSRFNGKPTGQLTAFHE